jgi:hypothetical protein
MNNSETRVTLGTVSELFIFVYTFGFLSCVPNATRVTELFIFVYTFGFLSCVPNVTRVSELFILVYTFDEQFSDTGSIGHTRQKTEGVNKNEQFRDTGSIGHTRQKTESVNKNEQFRDTFCLHLRFSVLCAQCYPCH